MTDQRYKIGTIASVLWIIMVGLLLINDLSGVKEMTPNDWGSFLSGVFAPLGFLWLVLGYLQQGEELKVNTKALYLQAEELKNSVEQQRALVEVSRLQVESEREALLDERRQRIERAKPNIVLESSGGLFRGDGQSTYRIQFSNSGNTACDMRITLSHQTGAAQCLFKAPAFSRGDRNFSSIEVDRPSRINEALIEVTYNDQLGNSYVDRYLIDRESDDPHASLVLLQKEADLN